MTRTGAPEALRVARGRQLRLRAGAPEAVRVGRGRR